MCEDMVWMCAWQHRHQAKLSLDVADTSRIAPAPGSVIDGSFNLLCALLPIQESKEASSSAVMRAPCNQSLWTEVSRQADFAGKRPSLRQSVLDGGPRIPDR